MIHTELGRRTSEQHRLPSDISERTYLYVLTRGTETCSEAAKTNNVDRFKGILATKYSVNIFIRSGTACIRIVALTAEQARPPVYSTSRGLYVNCLRVSLMA